MEKYENGHIFDRIESIKVSLLTITFFSIVGSYTILRELRDVLFVSVVGCEYIQYVQIIGMIALIPALLIYAALVDRLKKHQLLYVYSLVYACGSFLIGYYVAHPVIGLANGVADKARLFGWLQYLFIEGYTPFVISLFLAYLNSVTTPRSAAKSYSYVIAGSKLGGIVTALGSWWFLASAGSNDPIIMRWLLYGAAALLGIVPLAVKAIMIFIPEEALHGYEASYQRDISKKSNEPWYASITSGLTLMCRFPYAFGIFGLVFFWEIISVILNYKRLGLCIGLAKSATGLCSMFFLQIFWIHVTGFFTALIGTRVLLSLIGERWSLISVPVLTSFLVLGYFYSGTPALMLAFYILIRALNFSLSISVREVLFIPTTKEVRFKTKSWIDAFGTKCARGAGSFYSLLVDRLMPQALSPYIGFCLVIASFWMVTAYRLGKRYETALERDEVIG